MEELQSYRHPEWKRLFDEVEALLEPGVLLTYDDLKLAAGIDIKTSRGRGQFYRFADHVLRTLNLHLENVPEQGYRVVLPAEHGRCASREMTRARRRVTKALGISTHVRWEALTVEQSRQLTDLQARAANHERMLRGAVKDIRKIADAMLKPERLPRPALEAALENEQKPN